MATAFGDTVSVVSGGLACIAGALLLAWRLPGFTRLRSALHEQAAEHAGTAARWTRPRPPRPAGRDSRQRAHVPGATPAAGCLSCPVGAATAAATSSRRERYGELAGERRGELLVGQLAPFFSWPARFTV